MLSAKKYILGLSFLQAMLLVATIPVAFNVFLMALELVSYKHFEYFFYHVVVNTGVWMSGIGVILSCFALIVSALSRKANLAISAAILFCLNLFGIYANICAHI